MSEHSGEVVLRALALFEREIEVECVRPDRFADLSSGDIAALPVWAGRERRQLGDYFEVRGERSARVRVEGDVSPVSLLGAGMTGGTLIVESSVGHGLGRAMRGGTIHVRGNAGDGAGAAAPGASRGMSGGEIVIEGSAGSGVGANARRGLIAVGGNVGDGAGRSMIAGTVIVFGDAAADAGLWSKRGTVVAMGAIDMPPTYSYACTYRPTFLRVMLRSLRARYGLSVGEHFIDGEYRRHSGDMAELGKGEILQWAGR